MEEKIVSSLTDFIGLINSISKKDDDFFYRGESMIFKRPLLSNGFRNNGLIDSGTLERMKDDFFRDVGIKLDQDSRDNFTAYSQHHGLPTQLLDITKNPLVALYFATEKQQEKEGVVYVLPDNSHIVDPLSDFILDNEKEFKSLNRDIYSAKMSFEQSGGKLIKFTNNHFLCQIYERAEAIKSLEQYRYKDEYIENPNIPLDTTLMLSSYILKAHRKNVKYSVIHSKSNYKKNEKNLKELMLLLDKYNDARSKRELVHFYKEFQKIDFVRNLVIDPEPGADSFFSDILMTDEYNPKPIFLLFIISLNIRDNNFPPFPKIIYRPSITFDRLTNQQASFIYQVSMDKSLVMDNNESDNINVVTPKYQNFQYDYRILIKNKQQIKEELDRIGINEKFMYPDPDNVAHYIKQQYWK